MITVDMGRQEVVKKFKVCENYFWFCNIVLLRELYLVQLLNITMQAYTMNRSLWPFFIGTSGGL